MREIRPVRAKRPTILLFTAFVVLALAACGSGASLAPAERPVSGDGGAEAPSAAPSAGSDSGAPTPGGPTGLVDDAKIVRTGSMVLDVTDVGQAVTAGRDIVRGLGGYIGASNTSYKNDEPVASVTYRIPVEKWEEALAALRKLNGLTQKIVVEQTEAVEVTGQVIDLEARIKNLQASEAALQAISAKAGKISDVLEVQAQLTDVRGQIEVLTADLKDLNGRASYATLTVQFQMPVVAVEAAKKAWDPKVVVDEALASMVGILQGLAAAGIWFVIVGLPVLLAIALIVAVAGWILRRTGLWGRRLPPIPPASPPTPPAAPIAAD